MSIPSEQIPFQYNRTGKPELQRPHLETLSLNVSHADRLGLVALTNAHRINVDVERIQMDRFIEKIAGRYFSLNEVTTLISIDPSLRTEVFYHC